MEQIDLTQEFATIFKGNDLVYGRNILLDGYTDTGKRQSRSWLQKDSPTHAVWAKHLSGQEPIGVVPIQIDNRCQWGAIDVDLYQNKINFKELITVLETHQTPFVVLRSKSGGAHLYLFTTKPVPAKLMIQKLTEYSAWLGFGDCEIFPKQATLGSEESDTKYGNWIMMPYDGPDSLRYALTAEEHKIEATDFINLVASRRVPPAVFEQLEPPRPTQEVLPEGPPCLNHIFAERAQNNEMRNITLCNASVYLKKAHGDAWKDKLNELNQLFGEPLPDRELEVIKRSYDKKDYKYQCSKEPLCKFCNSSLCKTQKYGVAKNAVLPSNRSLTKLCTEPPIWYLNLGEKRIELNTEQLFNFQQFSKHCLETLNYIPEPCKVDEWRDIVNTLTANCTLVEIPEELQPIGIFKEILEMFVTEASQEAYEDMLRGIAYKDITHVYFRTRDLMERLKRERFTSFELNRITSILQGKPFFGKKKFVHLKKSGINCWMVSNIWDQPEDLEPKKPNASSPY